MNTHGLDLIPKTKKFHGETSVENNVDRLSALPEELISRILSVLPVEDAVRTDALSKKWRYRWTKLTSLALYDNFLSSRKRCKQEDFMIFLERVLILLGNQVIESFSLECHKQYDAARVHTWITALARREVQKLKVYCSAKGSLVFPACLFDRKSLIELHLLVPCKLKVPTSCCFSSMKTLRLSQVTFLNTSYPQSRVLSISLPLVEELSLWGCSWENVRRMYIDAPLLNIFSIGDFMHPYDHKLCRLGRPLGILDPQLHLITSTDKTVSFEGIVFISTSSISDATIELSTSYYWTSAHMMELLLSGLVKQFGSLKSLTLSHDTIIALTAQWKTSQNYPSLDSTLHLTITGGTRLFSAPFINFLLHLPRLESLRFRKGKPSFEGDCLRGLSKEYCPLSRLKVVEFSAINGRKDEVELAKFILKNATALEKLTIIARGPRKIREKSISAVRVEILHFPIASARASVEFHQKEA